MHNQKRLILPFDNKTIYQTKDGHKITSDTEFLVKTIIRLTNSEKIDVLDIGTGCGIISIMLKYYNPRWNVSGLDIQRELIELAKRNRKICNLNINFFEADIKKYDNTNGFDLIVSNPPYYQKGSGKMSLSSQKAISRFELAVCMQNILNAIKRLLKKRGRASILYPKFRLEEFKKSLVVSGLNLENIILSNKCFIGIISY